MNPKTSWGFLKILGTGFLVIFIGLLLLESLYLGIHERSISPIIKNIGSRLAYSTQHLSEASKQVIAQGYLYKPSQDFYGGIWGALKTIYVFFMSFYTLFAWVWVFAWIVARTPFSNKDNIFSNYFFGIVIFLLIQGIFILSMAGIDKQIDCFSKCDKGAIEYLISPVTSFIDFFKALEIILQPGFNIANKIEDIKGDVKNGSFGFN